jgi:hypothetical protein
MKYLISITLLLTFTIFVFSCSSNLTTNLSDGSHKVIIDGKEMLVGLIDKTELFLEFPVFKENYDAYNPNDDNIKTVKAVDKNIVIEIYLGTWCGDSRDNVPIFMKILDMAENSKIHVNLRAVDRTKIDPEKTSPRFNIVKVPTMIFLYQDQEFSRFVEVPDKSVEEDIIELIKKCPN